MIIFHHCECATCAASISINATAREILTTRLDTTNAGDYNPRHTFHSIGEFKMNEDHGLWNVCERCAADVEAGEKVCADCSRSVPMFEQSTSYQTILDMLVEAEENQIFTTA